jgi:hypothetical protein
LSGDPKTGRIGARSAAVVVALVIIVVSVVVGVLLQQKKEVVPSADAHRPSATVTQTVTATTTATPGTQVNPSPAAFPTGNMRASLILLCSFESIANSQGAVGGECPVAGVSVPVGGHRFAYQSDVGAPEHAPATWNDWIGFKNSDCTHLHLLFALDDDKSRPGDVAHVRVVRPSGTAHSKVERGSVGVLDADLDGNRAPFTLSSRATHSAHVYMRGYVVCPR